MGKGLISEISSYIGWILMSILKFLITPSLMIAAGYNWLEVVIICTVGATLGILLFYKAGKSIFSWWKTFKVSYFKPKQSKTRIVTKRKRQFLLFKEKYGLVGLSIISVFISVPITAVLGAKYFSNNYRTPIYLISAFFGWACVLTFLSWRVKSGLN